MASEKSVDSQNVVKAYVAQSAVGPNEAAEDGGRAQKPGTGCRIRLEKASQGCVPGGWPGGFRRGGGPGRMWGFSGQSEKASRYRLDVL